jgi:hypothetical protein
MMTATEKSKMRIGRGLFRLWLVLSVFWIAAVGTVTWQNWPVDERISPSQPPQASAPRMRECPSSTPDHPMVVDPVSGKCRPLMFDEIPDEATGSNNALPDAPWVIKERAQRAAALKLGVELALVPPVLVLVIGSALGWALKGFR